MNSIDMNIAEYPEPQYGDRVVILDERTSFFGKAGILTHKATQARMACLVVPDDNCRVEVSTTIGHLIQERFAKSLNMKELRARAADMKEIQRVAQATEKERMEAKEVATSVALEVTEVKSEVKSEVNVEKVPGKRRRARTTVDVTDAIRDESIAAYRGELGEDRKGGVVAQAKYFNVNPVMLSDAWKAVGVVPQRGRQAGSTVDTERAPREPKTPKVLDPAVVAQAIADYHAGKGGVTKLAILAGVPQPLLSEAFKAAGIELKRGRPAVAREVAVA